MEVSPRLTRPQWERLLGEAPSADIGERQGS